MSISRPSALSRDAVLDKSSQAAGRKPGHQVLPRQHRTIGLQTRGTGQVARRVDRLRGVVVVCYRGRKHRECRIAVQVFRRLHRSHPDARESHRWRSPRRGRSSTRLDTHAFFVVCPGTRCRSDRCSTRKSGCGVVRARNGGAAQGEALGLPTGVCHGSEPGNEGGG